MASRAQEEHEWYESEQWRAGEDDEPDYDWTRELEQLDNNNDDDEEDDEDDDTDDDDLSW